MQSIAGICKSSHLIAWSYTCQCREWENRVPVTMSSVLLQISPIFSLIIEASSSSLSVDFSGPHTQESNSLNSTADLLLNPALESVSILFPAMFQAPILDYPGTTWVPLLSNLPFISFPSHPPHCDGFLKHRWYLCCFKSFHHYYDSKGQAPESCMCLIRASWSVLETPPLLVAQQ